MRSLGFLALVFGMLILAAYAAAQIHTPSPRPTIVCGTTIVPVDPKIDPKAGRPVPRGQFTLRVQRPSVCGDRSYARLERLLDRLPQIFGPRR